MVEVGILQILESIQAIDPVDLRLWIVEEVDLHGFVSRCLW